ncbi:MAG: DoxX family protein [Bacteroidales bacterium]
MVESKKEGGGKLNRCNQIIAPYLVVILRIAIGALFIFSGFTKGIDPWGTIYKLEEYIQLFGLNYLENLLFLITVSLATLEFILGVSTILGCYRRITPLMIILVMVVMLPLSRYLMITNAVADCGCFGDLWVISNSATFWKNIVITIGAIYLLFNNRSIGNIYGHSVHWVIALMSFIYILWISILGYSYQPLINFRPFKVGEPLVNQMVDGVNIEFKFIYSKDGETSQFDLDNLPDDSWEYVDRVQVSDGVELSYKPDLHIYDGDIEVTEDVLIMEGDQIILLFPEMNDIDIPYTYTINEINEYAQSRGINVIALVSANDRDIEHWYEISLARYPVYKLDDSVLKQIARGNPAIVYLSDGVLKWRRTMQAISGLLYLQDDYEVSFLSEINSIESEGRLSRLTWGYLLSLLLLLIMNRTHLLWKIRPYISSKKENKDIPLQEEN